ncbi:protein-glutamate methylesterase/protein-glutamine glutaminase [Spirilliplanes yamanashiensis]|nr:chemotaxis response regulator protein-glutamate methylesterase [Spirilliplanes yamanashiensis]MDP9814406.1 two-component system chemotaxis response regulator CheB [Spirilliplanes yamanashiensis]
MPVVSVLVVDDSVVVRRLIVDALTGAPDVEVVGTAANGRIAQQKIDQLRPDVVTMDIEMPEMDGIEAVKELRKRHPRLPVIMFSTLSSAGAAATLDALAAGATDYVTKPANVGSVRESIAAVREQLVPKIHALGRRRPGAPVRPPTPGLAARPGLSAPPAPLRPAGVTAAPALTQPVAPLPGGGRVELLAIGSSTGGPDALAHLFQALPTSLPVPVVVTQHMPPVFTKMFAERLNRTTPLTVVEAEDGMPLRVGTVYVAPGDRHLVLRRRGTDVSTELSSAPPENSCRPAVDVMFRSVRALYGKSVLAVVLTGMGYDGREGARDLKGAGATVVAQDEQSSVVWGMPGAVAQAGLADAVLPLDQIPAALLARLGGRTVGV